MFNQIYDAFAGLEEYSLTDDNLQLLKNGLKEFNLIEGMFSGFIRKRMGQLISLNGFLNIQKNLENKELSQYESVFNRAIAWDFMFRNGNEAYFMQCLEYSESSEYSRFVDDLLACLSNSLSVQESINIIKRVSKGNQHRRNVMLLGVIAHRKEAMTIHADRLMDMLDDNDKVSLLAHSFSNPVILEFLQYTLHQDNVFDMFCDVISEEGDDAIIAVKIRNGAVPITNLSTFGPLLRLVIGCSPFLPQTLQYLLDEAKKEKCWDLLLRLGQVCPKRDILLELTKCPDKSIIEKFILRYKYDPEVKRLLAFI